MNINIRDVYVSKEYPQFILCSRLDFTLSSIKYLLPPSLKNEELLCIPTAAFVEEGYNPALDLDSKPLEYLGAQVEDFDISNKSEEEVKERLKNVRVLFIRGGNTAYLLEMMRKCNFETIIREKIQEGMIYIGASAGAVVLSDNIEYISAMDEFEKSSITNYEGFNIVPFKIIPHSNQPDLKKEVEEILKRGVLDNGSPLFLLKEEQLMCVRGNIIRFF